MHQYYEELKRIFDRDRNRAATVTKTVTKLTPTAPGLFSPWYSWGDG